MKCDKQTGQAHVLVVILCCFAESIMAESCHQRTGSVHCQVVCACVIPVYRPDIWPVTRWPLPWRSSKVLEKFFPLFKALESLWIRIWCL